MNAIALHHPFNEFYDHVTQTAAQLEEIGGDLYALESMISIAHDIEDLQLYQTHCYRLEATIYTLHKKIGSWQNGAKHRCTQLQGQAYKRHLNQLEKTLTLVNSYIVEVCRQKQRVMQIQQLLQDRKADFMSARSEPEEEIALVIPARIGIE